MKEIIDLDLYFKDFETKEDRRKVYASEFKPEYLDNTKILLQKVNSLLNDLGIKESDITSGWRPESINSKTPNAAKRSAHMICKAVDILDDKNQTLAKLVASSPDLLRKYGLFLEDPGATRGNNNWVHLDDMDRADRPSRIFKP